jgi:hypothetical protein
MGKTNAWITFAKKTYADMKRTNKNVSYSDALKVAGKKWKSQKRGGSTGVADNAATVSGGDSATDLDADAAADELDADADMVRASTKGGRRRRKSTKRKTRRGGKCSSGGKKRKTRRHRRR